MGMLALLLLVVSGLADKAASACNSGWQRTPADIGLGNFEAGANARPSYAPTGSSANIYVTNPTVLCGNACGQTSAAWIGIGAFDNKSNALIIQNGTFKENGGASGGCPAGVNTCGVPIPFFEVNVNPPAGSGRGDYNAFFRTLGPLNIGVYYEFDNEYDAGTDTVHLNFAGANNFSFDLSNTCISGDCQGVPTGGNWAPEAKGEVTSYSSQLPGTASNIEYLTTLELRHGSPSVWDTSTSQNWSSSGFPQGPFVSDPTASEIAASFKNVYSTTVHGEPYIQVWDTCTTH
jgi:hypothetical protein